MSAPASVAIVPMPVERVPEVTKIHVESFGGYMSTRLGTSYVRSFIHWFCQTEGSIALVAIDDHNRVVGYVIGGPVGYTRLINRDLFWVAAAGIILCPWLFFNAKFLRTLANRLRLILGCSAAPHSEPELPEPTMSLVAIGILPSARGKKIGLHLMQAFEARARELEMRSLRLSVYPNNTVARRLYQRCGWQPFINSTREKGSMYYFRVLSKHSDMKT